MRSHKGDGCLQILLKSVADALALLVEVGDGLVNLCLGRLEESRPHYLLRDRSCSKTSSAETASILPALYSAYRRSASSAHNCSFSSAESSSRLSRRRLASSARA